MKGGLCETCIAPGHCCKSLYLSGGPTSDLGEKIDSPMSFERAERMSMSLGLPFRPSEQQDNGVWMWTCNMVDSHGRCTIYETRPQLCRDFAPGSGPLCVHYVAPDEIEELAA